MAEAFTISLLISVFLATSVGAELESDFCEYFPDDPACNCPSPPRPMMDIPTPLGEIKTLPLVELSGVGPEFLAALPSPAEPRPFRAPSIFSAPLPAGSGARALGFAGAFTGIADDATAASWNPAGLIQLERPEVSAVYRYSSFENEHSSSDEDFLVGEDDYESQGLNYLTLSLPFNFPGLDKVAVFSLNYQEAYDFVHSFSARFRDSRQQQFFSERQATFAETQIDRFVSQRASFLETEFELKREITARSSSTLRQTVDSEVFEELDFRQEGVIDAISPAMAFEIHPRFSIGFALNFYRDNTFRSGRIGSETRVGFTGTAETRSRLVNRRVTSGTFIETETDTFLFGGDKFSGETRTTNGKLPEVVEEELVERTDLRVVDGEVIELNEFGGVDGFNSTLGLWWMANDFLTLGAAVDLPWNADTEQTRTITTKTTTFDRNRSHILATSESTETEKKDVELEFPMFATLGAFILWNPHLYTAVDVGYATWSDLAYNINGEGRISPFDGTPQGHNEIDDTWSVHIGTEWLMEFEWNKIVAPLRFGLVWDQRPAIDNPDDYYGFSVGSGIAVGNDPGKLIVDVAFNYLQADDVQTVIPEEDSLSTDTQQFQFFVSVIKHL